MSDLRFEICTSDSHRPGEFKFDLDTPVDDHRSILAALCDELSQYIDFRVSGFGQSRWPVDVETDLPIFLEQLPGAIMKANTGHEFEIDFYEQGLERRLEFIPDGSSFHVTCASGTDWRPDPLFQEIDRLDLIAILRLPLRQFIEAVESVSSEVFHDPLVRAWRNGE